MSENQLNSSDSQEFSELMNQLRLTALTDFLEKQRTPVWECELMQIALPEANLLHGTTLDMYRWHFVLFNALYRLMPEFSRRGLYLHIHFMRTCVQEYPEPSLCQYFDDELTGFCRVPCAGSTQWCDFHADRIDETAVDWLSDRYFYLDTTNFMALSAENADKFIAGAWNLLQNHADYMQCLKVMGLPEGVSVDILKKRFRHLAKTLHPDINPVHHEEFARINSAYRRLLAYFGNSCRLLQPEKI